MNTAPNAGETSPALSCVAGSPGCAFVRGLYVERMTVIECHVDLCTLRCLVYRRTDCAGPVFGIRENFFSSAHVKL